MGCIEHSSEHGLRDTDFDYNCCELLGVVYLIN